MDVVSIDLVHLLVSVRKGGSGNITVLSLMECVRSSSGWFRRGTSLGLAFY
jgi:hypothetical protein